MSHSHSLPSPPSGTTRDFTTPQTYTVTASGGAGTKDYTVTATVGTAPAIFTWTNPVSDSWSNASNWTNDLGTGTEPGYFGGSNYTLNFTTPGTYSVTNDLSDGFLLNQLNFDGTVTLDSPAGLNPGGLTFAADGATLPRVNQNSGNAVWIMVPLNLATNTTVGGTGSGQVTVDKAVSGTGGLTKDGSGTLHLYAEPPSPYSGGTIINDGTLRLGRFIGGISKDVIDPVGTGTVTLNDGTLYLGRVKVSNALLVNGGKIYQQNGWGATWSGPVTLNADLSCETFYTLTISGDISGTGGLTKTLNGPLKLTGSNDYSGDTTVNAGTLEVYGSSISDAGKLIIDGGLVKPNGTERVDTLFFGDVQQDAGTYGATGSGAGTISDAHFSGSAGVVEVLSGPSSGGSMFFAR